MRLLTIVSFLFVGGLFVAEASTAVTRAQCPTNPYCRIVDDADSDGEISDDLRRARSELLYASGAGPNDTVYLFPPVDGTYSWVGQVRFCGDDTPPTGEVEPDCDGTAELPYIVFAGRWSSVVLESSCAEDASFGGYSACLRIGDRLEGDGGADEPRPRVLTHQALRFRHVFIFGSDDWGTELNHPVFAVWLDGVTMSIFGVEVGRDIPEQIYRTGSGIWISATDSSVVTNFLAEPTSTLIVGAVVDGGMSGSTVRAVADLSSGPEGMNPVVLVGGVNGFIPFMYGPPDGCAYGPDPPQSCRDFAIEAVINTPPVPSGGEGVFLADGDDIAVNIQANYLTRGHHLFKAAGLATTPGSVGDVTLTGEAVYAGLNKANPPGTMSAIIAAPEATVLVDMKLTSLSTPTPVCATGGGIVLGPNYQCIGTPQP